MSYAGTFVAPTWTPASTPPPILFLAPELWGEKVAEHRRGGDGPGGTIRWTPISARKGGGAGATTAGTAACKDSVDELMWITSCFEPASAAASAGELGQLPPYPHEEHIKPRATAANKSFASAETVAIVLSFALAGYAIVGIPANQGSTQGEPTATQAGILLPATAEPMEIPASGAPVEIPALSTEATPEPMLEISSMFPIISNAFGPINTSFPDPPKGAAARDAGDPGAKGDSADRATVRRARRPRRVNPEATAVAAAHWEAAIAPHLAPEPADDEQTSSEMVFGRDELMAQSLTPTQIRIGLRRVAPLVRNCTDDGPLTTQIGLAISGDQGRVTRVRLGRPLAGTREGACVTRALRRARFPRFADPSVELSSFPLVIR